MTQLLRDFQRRLRASERRRLASLRSPERIQAFLDEASYIGEERYRCPLTFMRDGGGHCFDGAVFAALALRRLGLGSVLIDLLPNDRDDDHVVAVYRRGQAWGALAKSNYSGIRSREPVYRSVRELAMSYFEGFFNVTGERTLRAYTRPLDLTRFDDLGWPWSDAALDRIGDGLETARWYPLLDAAQIRRLTRVDARSRAAGLLGSRRSELFRPD